MQRREDVLKLYFEVRMLFITVCKKLDENYLIYLQRLLKDGEFFLRLFV